MDEAKRKEIEGKVADCKLKIANEEAKLKRYEMQLQVGKTGHTKARAKVTAKPAKTAPKAESTPPKDSEEKGFFATVFS